MSSFPSSAADIHKMVRPIDKAKRQHIEKLLACMRTKELKIIARDEKISLRSVQRFHKNLKHHGHTYNLPSDISQRRPHKFTVQMEQVCLWHCI